MDKQFWINCWENNSIGFHEERPNQLMTSHFEFFSKKLLGKRLFVPMCGKSNDMIWFMQQGYHVVGAELSQIAVEDFFDNLNISPKILETTQFKQFSAPNIDIFVGDIFKLSSNEIGNVDAVYDRAALVAWAPDMQQRYVQHIVDMTNHAPQLVLTFDFFNKQIEKMSSKELIESYKQGPPFFITLEQMTKLYSSHYTINCIDNTLSHHTIRQIKPVESIWECRPRDLT